MTKIFSPNFRGRPWFGSAGKNSRFGWGEAMTCAAKKDLCPRGSGDQRYEVKQALLQFTKLIISQGGTVALSACSTSCTARQGRALVSGKQF